MAGQRQRASETAAFAEVLTKDLGDRASSSWGAFCLHEPR